MFSSWMPTSALVDGVNTGSGSSADSCRPAGSGVPCMVPPALYSFHAEPVRRPRTMHSTGSISARRQSITRPASSGCWASGGQSARSVDRRWLPITSPSCSTQKAVMAVSTRPLWGMGSAITTSKAESRSEVTIRRLPSPAS